ncbi:RecX family transcriptional regulator [Chitinophaga sp. SYP-B3965]|uniref:regulatory protein RecX n=1 Tax=Chitinophaga sp. SYP-B3965 TaxID=2663120 RepID=UPI0012995C36|nr:regulatory protein RecX [Chitinophaga sp. SYP-B3965]MRG46831.1 RecX family transcriptional regulator [Chitinophaga sp. SYP-B3965]
MEADILKLRYYCAYQERCHMEVREKCWELGLRGEDIENAIAHLVENGFLNEERFAKAYAGGKFRMQQWGRKKISMMLKQKQVSEYCIRKGLAEINADDYMQTLEQLASRKYASLKSEQYLKRQYKTLQFLLQRGFEQDLARAAIEQIAKKGE